MMKWNRGLWALGAIAVGVMAVSAVASADVNDVSTERGGSIIVLPKVVWDGTSDTIIQISNTSNEMVWAQCFYVNGQTVTVGQPPSLDNPQLCSETDFLILLTRQQPTHWSASSGRQTSFDDTFASDGSGFDPGLVPPVPLNFTGELKCIQVDDSDVPFRGNALKGEATIITTTGDVSEYNAIAFHGNTDSGVQEGDPNDLFLDLTANNPALGRGPNDGEYSACPDVLILNHFKDGVNDLVTSQIGDCDSGEGGCPVDTLLTLVPCNEDLENQVFTPTTVSFQVFDEFERELSGSITIGCYLSERLSEIASAFGQLLPSMSGHTRINPNPGDGGVIGIAEEIRYGDCNGVTGCTNASRAHRPSATAAFNLYIEGNRFDAATNGKGTLLPNGVTDHIIIPSE
jgi:hypothetical protein